MTINNRQDYVILDLIQQAVRNVRAMPVNLGGVSGGGGGEGTPPGGFIGLLAQTKVAYDTTEAAYAGILSTPSGTLVDNLAHIRYRLNSLEAGSGGSPLTVDELDGSPSISNVNHITFSGAIVTDLGGGHVLVESSSAIPSGGKFAIVSSNYVDTTIADGMSDILILDTEVVDDSDLVTLSGNLVSVSDEGWYDLDVLVAVNINSGSPVTQDGSLEILLSNTGTFDNTQSYHSIISGDTVNYKDFSTKGSVYLTTGDTFRVDLINNTGHSVDAYVHEVLVKPSLNSGGEASSTVNKITFVEQGSSPSAPPTGYGYLYIKSDGLYFKDDSGTEIGPFSTGGGGVSSAKYSGDVNTTTINNGSAGTITITDEVWDVSGLASVSSDIITIGTAGTYNITVEIFWDKPVSGTPNGLLGIHVNTSAGNHQHWEHFETADDMASNNIHMSWTDVFSSSDTIEVTAENYMGMQIRFNVREVTLMKIG